MAREAEILRFGCHVVDCLAHAHSLLRFINCLIDQTIRSACVAQSQQGLCQVPFRLRVSGIGGHDLLELYHSVIEHRSVE